MKFQRASEKRALAQTTDAAAAAPSTEQCNPQAQAISRFYADLVQTSGSRWAGTPGESGSNPGEARSGAGDAAASAAAPGSAAQAQQDSILERTTITPAGVVILEPQRGPAEAESGTGAAAAGIARGAGLAPARHRLGPPTAAVCLGISKKNVGYQLLQKAGWTEGTGLGAQEQGRQEPLAPTAIVGQVGLGFQPAANKQRKLARAAQPAQEGAQPAAAQQGQQQQQQRPKRPLPEDPLEKEDLDTKVKRVKQVLQAEADDRAGKAIQRYIHMAFNDATGEPTADDNPLLRRGRSKLSATNPLL